MNLVALDGTLNPAVAKRIVGPAEDVLHVNLTVLAIDDVHAVAVLGANIEAITVVVNHVTSAVVGLELASGLIGDHTEVVLGLQIFGIKLGHLGVDDPVALHDTVCLEVYACRCADGDCGCNQKYR